jgi:GTPase SAR1 family protein
MAHRKLKECRLTLIGGPKVGKSILAVQFIRNFPYGDASLIEHRRIFKEIISHEASRSETFFHWLAPDTLHLIEQKLTQELPELNFTCDNTYKIPVAGHDGNEVMLVINDPFISNSTWATRTKMAEWMQTSNVFVLMYDITNRSSFEDILPLLELLYSRTFVQICPLILCGTKADLEQQRKVSKREGETLAALLKVPHLEISSHTGQNVLELFRQSVKEVKGFKRKPLIQRPMKPTGCTGPLTKGKLPWMWIPCLCCLLALISFSPWAIMLSYSAIVH